MSNGEYRPDRWTSTRELRIGECVHGNGLAVCHICKRNQNPMLVGEDKLEDLVKKINVEDAFKDLLKDQDPGPARAVYTGYEDIDAFLDDCLDTMRKKGHDYRQGNDDDVLHNFRTVAEAVDSDMMKVWFTYFYKHFSAMATFIKEGGQSESEPIEGRIKDQIVYLLLFYRMVQEKKAPVQHHSV
jgi:hypothetical protein